MRPQREVAQIKKDLEREKWAVQVGTTTTGILVGVIAEVLLWVLRFFIPTAFSNLPFGSSFLIALILGTVLGAWLNSWADRQPEGHDR